MQIFHELCRDTYKQQGSLGLILKKLLEQEMIAIKDLGVLIKKDFITAENEWLETLIQELIDEGFIVKKQGMIVLAS